MNIRVDDKPTKEETDTDNNGFVVFYVFIDPKGGWGNGFTNFTGPGIRNQKDLNNVLKMIRDNQKNEQLTIIGWQRYDKEEEDEPEKDGQV